MKTYTVDLTLSIDAMTEESAENKLDAFLSALDLKKNDKNLTEQLKSLSLLSRQSKRCFKIFVMPSVKIANLWSLD